MAAQESQIVVSFTEGVTEGVATEVAEGAVTRSENTRLSKLKGTVCRRPSEVVIGSVFSAPPCGGMAMGVRDSAIAYFKPTHDPRRIVDVYDERLVSPSLGTIGANAYYPYALVESGVMGGEHLAAAPATCFDSGNRQWFASSKDLAPGSRGVFVAVVEEGEDLITPRVVVTVAGFSTNLPSWVGLTPCTGGVILWYSTATTIVCRKLTIASGVLVVDAPHTVFTPLAPGGLIDADVTSDGANVGFLICRDDVAGTSLSLKSINLTTFASINATTIASVGSTATVPIRYCLTYFVTGAGVAGLAIATSNFAGDCYRSVRSTNLIALWSSTTFFGFGVVSALPFELFGRDSVIFAVTLFAAVGVGTDWTVTNFAEVTRTAGLSVGSVSIPWWVLQGKGVAHKPSQGETYPYFPLYPQWGPYSAPSDPNYMDAPQIVVVTPYAPDGPTPITQMTPVLRCGVDRVSPQSSDYFNSAPSALSPDGRYGLTYLEDRLDQPMYLSSGHTARYCVFDLASAGQPGVAADVGPVAALATGLVAVWDGQETTEYAPFTRPRIAVDQSGGTGPLLTGDYYYTAVVSWRDAAGNVRRSPPATPITRTFAGEAPVIYVSVPLTMRNGIRQEIFAVDIYATLDGGSIFYSITASQLVGGGGIDGCWVYDSIDDTVAGTLQLYSLGGTNEPLLPECPPPAWDIRAIVGRLWLIDAENRYRLLPSLLKQQGIALEFNSNLEIVTFDQQYGKLVAVVDVGGTPFVLAERGIWRVDGYGPDNAGMGGSFTDPALVFNVGCRSRLSVTQVPGVGVLFQCNDGRFALLTGGLQRFETFGVYDVGPSTIHLLQNEVIYPLADGTGFLVYNWLANGWTKWPTATRVMQSTTMLQTDARSRTYYYASDGSLLIMDSDTIDTTVARPLRVERGWVAPAGPQGDCVIREFWVHCIYNTPHSIKVRASFDYDTTAFVERTWTDLELVPLLQDGRYTVGMNCEAMPSRALRVLVTFTPSGTGETGQPLTLTVTYGASPGIRRRTLPDGAIK